MWKKSTFLKARNAVINWTRVPRKNTFQVSRFTAFFYLYMYLILPILLVLCGNVLNQGIFLLIHWIFKGKLKHGERRDCLKEVLYGNPKQ